MGLDEYRRKRKFDRTQEPEDDKATSRAGRAIFVVQLHHARRRHYDFRLQVGQTLKSWAVPKGPSMDPAVKRLAVEVEDHPLAYADFEGDIAPGNYGAGHVDTFDRGVWTTQGDAQAQLKQGHLRFELFGQRLHGRWHLVRSTKSALKPTWLLIKVEDAYADAVEADDLLAASTAKPHRDESKQTAAVSANQQPLQPKSPVRARRTSNTHLAKLAAALSKSRKAPISTAAFEPELARSCATPPEGDDWLHEVKWDGYRLIASVVNGTVHLTSRNGLDWNQRLPEIVEAVASLGLDSAQLDGELIALDGRGHSDFNLLQKTLSGVAHARLMYMLFDLIYVQGYQLDACPLIERKALLETLLAKPPASLGLSTHSRGHGAAAFAMAEVQALEGIVSKRAHSPYRGGRGDDWLKAKRLLSDEFAVVGFTQAKGSRKGFGALLLASPNKDGTWQYVGRVGSGFSDVLLAELGQTLADSVTATPNFELSGMDRALRDAYWVTPTQVVEVFYRGLAGNGLLRQASLKALREDKSPNDLVDDDHMPSNQAKAKPGRPPQANTKAAASARAQRQDATVTAQSTSKSKAAQTHVAKRATSSAAVTISHPQRVVFARAKVTKSDVADYYHEVMDWFLPTVVDRPLSILRCPEGIAEACFFQKHPLAGLQHVDSVRLKEESAEAAMYLVARDAQSVIELVQFGTLEFHPWGAKASDPEHADIMVFDLDPDASISWKRMRAAARLLRKRLREAGLESFVRTTGGKGLHVVVPLHPACAWDEVKAFARGFAHTLAQMHPDEFVAVASKRQRKDRIYIDYLRNARGSTSVASYSLRARVGAPVAVPLRWQDLGRIKSGDAFDIHSVTARLARLHSDPWAGFDSLQQDLTCAELRR